MVVAEGRIQGATRGQGRNNCQGTGGEWVVQVKRNSVSMVVTESAIGVGNDYYRSKC